MLRHPSCWEGRSLGEIKGNWSVVGVLAGLVIIARHKHTLALSSWFCLMTRCRVGKTMIASGSTIWENNVSFDNWPTRRRRRRRLQTQEKKHCALTSGWWLDDDCIYVELWLSDSIMYIYQLQRHQYINPLLRILLRMNLLHDIILGLGLVLGIGLGIGLVSFFFTFISGRQGENVQGEHPRVEYVVHPLQLLVHTASPWVNAPTRRTANISARN